METKAILLDGKDIRQLGFSWLAIFFIPMQMELHAPIAFRAWQIARIQVDLQPCGGVHTANSDWVSSDGNGEIGGFTGGDGWKGLRFRVASSPVVPEDNADAWILPVGIRMVFHMKICMEPWPFACIQ